MRSGSHKLLHFYKDGHDELYDLSSDIGERKNLAKSLPEQTAELRGKLEGWLEEVKARRPRWEK